MSGDDLVTALADAALAVVAGRLPTREHMAQVIWDTCEATMYPHDPQPWEDWKDGPDGVAMRACADAILRDLRGRLGV